MLKTLDYAIRIGSTPTFLYFDLYLNSAYAAHYVYYPDMRPYNRLIISQPADRQLASLADVFGLLFPPTNVLSPLSRNKPIISAFRNRQRDPAQISRENQWAIPELFTN